MDEEIASVTVVAAPSGELDDNEYGVFDDTQGEKDGLKSGGPSGNGVERDLGILAFIGLASIIEFWQAADLCSNDEGYAALVDNCSGRNGYAIAAGVVSGAVCLIYVALNRFGFVKHGGQVATLLSAFLAGWWFFATCVGTFKGPFTVPSNGFIAEWFCMLASFYLVYLNVPRVKAFVDGLEDIGDEIKIVYAIAFASFVVMIAGSIACDDAQDCKDEIAFSVACPVISLLVTAAVIFMGQNISKEMNASCLFFLAIWWFIGISVLTFEQPFVIVGNGFAGTWAGFVLSSYACGATIQHVPVVGKILSGGSKN